MRSSRLRSSRCQRCCIAPLDQPRIVPGDMRVIGTNSEGAWDYFRIVRHPGATRLAALKLFTEALNGVSPVRVPKTVID